MARPDEVDVLVVGAGPCGLMAGNTLAEFGLDVLVVEKRNGESTLSRALVVSTRGMELMRRLGLEAAVRAGASIVEPTALVTRTLTANDGVVTPLGYPSDAEAEAISPTRPSWTPQSDLEPLLRTRLEAGPTATVCFGHELVNLHQGDDGVEATMLEEATLKQRRVHAQHVIAADGAHSTVRSLLGIGMDGPAELSFYERVEFTADLDDAVGDRRHALYVLQHPMVEGAVLARRGREDHWSLSRECPLDDPGLDDLTELEIIWLLRAATGLNSLDARIERLSRFAFAAQIAERYRDGHCWLIGDAAHRMTPRGGTGMNTGIQDAFDLGWKIAWVLRGWAPTRLLDTYERERRPIALHNIGRAASAGGAKRTTEEALPWDLDDRLAHCWVDHAERVSTLDLIGTGLTLFTATSDPRWSDVAGQTAFTAPLEIVQITSEVALALQLGPSGAVLVRPDGHEIARWTAASEKLDPRVAWLDD